MSLRPPSQPDAVRNRLQLQFHSGLRKSLGGALKLLILSFVSEPLRNRSDLLIDILDHGCPNTAWAEPSQGTSKDQSLYLIKASFSQSPWLRRSVKSLRSRGVLAPPVLRPAVKGAPAAEARLNADHRFRLHTNNLCGPACSPEWSDGQ